MLRVIGIFWIDASAIGQWQIMLLCLLFFMIMPGLIKPELFGNYWSPKIGPLSHHAYSTDINPTDFNCFGPLKEQVKRKRYSNSNELVEGIRSAILKLNQMGTFNSVNKLPEVWAQVVEKSGS